MFNMITETVTPEKALVITTILAMGLLGVHASLRSKAKYEKLANYVYNVATVVASLVGVFGMMLIIKVSSAGAAMSVGFEFSILLVVFVGLFLAIHVYGD